MNMFADSGLDLDFKEFHKNNPHVYETLVKLAHEAKDRGKTKIGIKMLWEVARWELMLKTTESEEGFSLNNNYHSRYARLIMDQEKDLDGIFQIRSLKT